jgi:glycosyltransferase involved in cell wall biosynthesis
MAAEARPTVVGIMPLYNGEPWVAQALDSVLAQTILPDEFLIVDDGGTDGARAIADAYAAEHPFIRVLSTGTAGGGQSAARNLAIAASSCDLVALIDQDDVWYPNHIEQLLRAVRDHRGLRLGWVYSDFDDIDLDGRLIMRDFVQRQDHENPKRDLRRVLADGFVIQPSATLIDRLAIIEVGGFDERLSGYEDDDLFLRLFIGNYDNVWVPEPTSQWRIHESSSGASDRMDDSLRYYGQKLITSFPDDRWRGLYYRRDVVAPRIMATWVQMYVRASRYHNAVKMRMYAREARRYTRYLPPRRRVMWFWLLWILRLRPVVRLRIATVDDDSILLAPFISLARRAARM